MPSAVNGGRADDDDIVLSGLSGRLPEADTIEEFAQKLFDGVDLVTADDRRWTPGLHGLPERSGKLKELAHFDATHFGVHAKQAHLMDPQLRLLLELTHEALVDAGVAPAELRGSRTGVFVGVSNSETEELWTADPDRITGYALTGCCRAMFPNRISYAFDLRGPSYAVDTACSSSLFALAHAAAAMRAGHCDAAVVAGCNLCLKPANSLNFHRLGMLSPEGRCAAFDAAGRGYVRSEAAVVVLLQRRGAARRAYAALRGARTNTDGAKEQGITFPSGDMQRRLAEETFREAGLRPQDVAYVEAHGTGTKVGDPQEVNAIAELFCRGRAAPLPLGSVKSNMGHSEPASGLCAVAKVLLAMERGVLPANLHYRTPNPDIPALADGRIRVVAENTPWDGGLVAVNSFGFGGANAHVILESARGGRPPPAAYAAPRLLVASGRTRDAADALLALGAEHAADAELHALLDAVHAHAAPTHGFRGYALLTEPPQREVLEAEGGEARPVWFVFSGMGSQWAGMARALLRLPAFAASVARSAAALAPHGVDLVHVLSEAPDAAFDDVVASFVSIAAVQVALVDVLRAVGVRPDGIVGHSVGEIGCAYADETLTGEQAVLAAYWRGRSIVDARLPAGAMAAVGLAWDECARRCPAGVVPACHNAADSVTVSGPPDAVERFARELAAEGVFARRVASSGVAFHSEYIAAAAPLLRRSLERVIPAPRPRSPRWVSSSLPREQWGSPLARLSDAAYHVNNLLSPVRFADALRAVPERAVVVEVAPHALLQAVLKRALPAPGAAHVPLVRRDAPDACAHLLAALGRLYAAGAPVRAGALYPPVRWPVSRGTPGLASRVRWDHSVEWSVAHYGAARSGENVIEYDLAKPDDAFLAGHNIDGRILFPATGYLTLVWRTMAKLHNKKLEETAVVLENVQFRRATIVQRDAPVRFLVNVLEGAGEFEVCEGGAVAVSGAVRLCADPAAERLPRGRRVQGAAAARLQLRRRVPRHPLVGRARHRRHARLGGQLDLVHGHDAAVRHHRRGHARAVPAHAAAARAHRPGAPAGGGGGGGGGGRRAAGADAARRGRDRVRRRRVPRREDEPGAAARARAGRAQAGEVRVRAVRRRGRGGRGGGARARRGAARVPADRAGERGRAAAQAAGGGAGPRARAAAGAAGAGRAGGGAAGARGRVAGRRRARARLRRAHAAARHQGDAEGPAERAARLRLPRGAGRRRAEPPRGRAAAPGGRARRRRHAAAGGAARRARRAPRAARRAAAGRGRAPAGRLRRAAAAAPPRRAAARAPRRRAGRRLRVGGAAARGAAPRRGRAAARVRGGARRARRRARPGRLPARRARRARAARRVRAGRARVRGGRGAVRGAAAARPGRERAARRRVGQLPAPAAGRRGRRAARGARVREHADARRPRLAALDRERPAARGRAPDAARRRAVPRVLRAAQLPRRDARHRQAAAGRAARRPRRPGVHPRARVRRPRRRRAARDGHGGGARARHHRARRPRLPVGRAGRLEPGAGGHGAGRVRHGVLRAERARAHAARRGRARARGHGRRGAGGDRDRAARRLHGVRDGGHAGQARVPALALPRAAGRERRQLARLQLRAAGAGAHARPRRRPRAQLAGGRQARGVGALPGGGRPLPRDRQAGPVRRHAARHERVPQEHHVPRHPAGRAVRRGGGGGRGRRQGGRGALRDGGHRERRRAAAARHRVLGARAGARLPLHGGRPARGQGAAARARRGALRPVRPVRPAPRARAAAHLLPPRQELRARRRAGRVRAGAGAVAGGARRGGARVQLALGRAQRLPGVVRAALARARRARARVHRRRRHAAGRARAAARRGRARARRRRVQPGRRARRRVPREPDRGRLPRRRAPQGGLHARAGRGVARAGARAGLLRGVLVGVVRARQPRPEQLRARQLGHGAHRGAAPGRRAARPGRAVGRRGRGGADRGHDGRRRRRGGRHGAAAHRVVHARAGRAAGAAARRGRQHGAGRQAARGAGARARPAARRRQHPRHRGPRQGGRRRHARRARHGLADGRRDQADARARLRRGARRAGHPRAHLRPPARAGRRRARRRRRAARRRAARRRRRRARRRPGAVRGGRRAGAPAGGGEAAQRRRRRRHAARVHGDADRGRGGAAARAGGGRARARVRAAVHARRAARRHGGAGALLRGARARAAARAALHAAGLLVRRGRGLRDGAAAAGGGLRGAPRARGRLARLRGHAHRARQAQARRALRARRRGGRARLLRAAVRGRGRGAPRRRAGAAGVVGGAAGARHRAGGGRGPRAARAGRRRRRLLPQAGGGGRVPAGRRAGGARHAVRRQRQLRGAGRRLRAGRRVRGPAAHAPPARHAPLHPAGRGGRRHRRPPLRAAGAALARRGAARRALRFTVRGTLYSRVCNCRVSSAPACDTTHSRGGASLDVTRSMRMFKFSKRNEKSQHHLVYTGTFHVNYLSVNAA